MGAPSAIQSIVTLNIPNTSTLDLLLAGLLDNTTGGPYTVNGTFESVTSQVEFLGLVPTVMYAIPNATEPSDGLWGPPTAQAPAAPSSGLFGAFWNAVTSFVTNPLGTVESLVDTVWDVAEAATVYLDHLATEGLAIGAQVLARTSAAVIRAGQLFASALDVFVQYIASLVREALAAVIDPILSGIGPYSASVVDATRAAYNDSKVSSTDASRFGSALSGTIFELGLGLGTVAMAALIIAMPFDLGPGFLVGVMLSLLTVSVAAEFPKVSGVSSFSAAAVDAVESWLNMTNANSTVKNTKQWGTAAGIIGLVGGLSDSPAALGMLYAELFPPDEVQGNPITAIVVLALDVAVIALGLYLVVHNNVTTAVIVLALAFMALTATAYHFLTSEVVAEVPALKLLGYVDLGISGVGAAAILLDLGILLS